MKNSGFVNSSYFCEGLHNPPPSCQPSAIIPTRSVERRLNSYYCKNYGKNTPECQFPGHEVSPQKSVPAEKPVSDSDANNYFEQNRFREQTEKLQQDMQNNSNRQMEKMLEDTAPKIRRQILNVKKDKPMKRAIAISLLISTISTGCGIFPTINCSKTTGIKVGMTEKELINLMGDPYFVSISSKAGKIEKILGWQNKESPIESTNLIRVKISSDGKVTDFYGKCDSHDIKTYHKQ